MNGSEKTLTKQLPNLKLTSDILPERVLVCGDPGRAKMIADLLDNPVQLAQNREYHTYSGSWNGKQVAVVSHGVGAPGAAVCFEELIMGGVQSIIRVGTAGSYQKEVTPGSLVVSTAAVSCDGLTKQIVPPGFPAVADRKVVEALSNAAGKNIPVKEGITLTLDAFYSGVLEFPHQLYKKAGVLAVDMENSALFVIAALKGVQAGAILAIDGYADAELRDEYNPHNDLVSNAVEAEMKIALDAITAL
ncbi:nucleoside phosphorylase [Neobacillus niacini]|uniref:nucleoside phosphorylase n=1 Tax=Neobacillus niacini TaxID=86668 RepID=UPI0005EEFE48|nr:nucleoside phosphorylase [Neobacillus niacini]